MQQEVPVYNKGAAKSVPRQKLQFLKNKVCVHWLYKVYTSSARAEIANIRFTSVTD